jgi:Outer membrane protein beta-barrel domain
MKKIIPLSLFLVISMLSLGASAQILNLRAGTKVIGGVIGIEYEEHDNDIGSNTSSKTLSVHPMGGIFITNNLAIIGSLGYVTKSGNITTLDYAGDYDQATVQIGVRYYQPFFTLYLYAGMEAGYQRTMTEDGNQNDLNHDDLSFSIPAGMLYPLNKHVGLDLGIRFNYLMRDDSHTNDYNKTSFSMGYLGIQVFF